MNFLLAVGVEQWILLGILVLFLIGAPFVMRARNKREMANAQKMIDSIKKGDNVLTASGVIGKVISLDNKQGYKTVTIETGDEKHKGYITLDVAAIYANLSNPVTPEKTDNNEKSAKQEEQHTEEQPSQEQVQEQEQQVQQEQEQVQEQPQDVQQEEVKEKKSKTKSKK